VCGVWRAATFIKSSVECQLRSTLARCRRPPPIVARSPFRPFIRSATDRRPPSWNGRRWLIAGRRVALPARDP